MAAFERVLTSNVGKPEALTLQGLPPGRRLRGARQGADDGAGRDHRRGQEVGPARPRRRRLPRRHEVGLHPQGKDKPKYLVCNADESEPGTFKDRLLMEHDPHQLIEGCAICCCAVQAGRCYIYIRGEYTKAAAILERALEEAYEGGHPRRQRDGLGLQARHVRPPRRRRLHLRRGDRDAGVARGQARPAARQAAVPGGRRRLRRAHRDQQRRDAVQRAAHPHPRRRLVQGDRHGRAQHRPQALRHLRPRGAAGHLRVPDRRHLPRDAGGRGRHVEAAASSRRSSRAAPRRPSSRPIRSTSRWTSTRSPRRARCSARRR